MCHSPIMGFSRGITNRTVVISYVIDSAFHCLLDLYIIGVEGFPQSIEVRIKEEPNAVISKIWGQIIGEIMIWTIIISINDAEYGIPDRIIFAYSHIRCVSYISGNNWTSIASTPTAVQAGGALTNDGTYIYGFGGGGTNEFWKYDITGNTWSSLAGPPGTIGGGGSLTYDGEYVYAFRGGGARTIIGDTTSHQITGRQ